MTRASVKKSLHSLWVGRAKNPIGGLSGMKVVLAGPGRGQAGRVAKTVSTKD